MEQASQCKYIDSLGLIIHLLKPKTFLQGSYISWYSLSASRENYYANKN